MKVQVNPTEKRKEAEPKIRRLGNRGMLIVSTDDLDQIRFIRHDHKRDQFEIFDPSDGHRMNEAAFLEVKTYADGKETIFCNGTLYTVLNDSLTIQND